MVGTAAERRGLVYRVTAYTSSPSARFRMSSQYSFVAFFIALFRAFFGSFTSSCQCCCSPPPLLLLVTQPASRRFVLMSSLHQRSDRAQVVMTLVVY